MGCAVSASRTTRGGSRGWALRRPHRRDPANQVLSLNHAVRRSISPQNNDQQRQTMATNERRFRCSGAVSARLGWSEQPSGQNPAYGRLATTSFFLPSSARSRPKLESGPQSVLTSAAGAAFREPPRDVQRLTQGHRGSTRCPSGGVPGRASSPRGRAHTAGRNDLRLGLGAGAGPSRPTSSTSPLTSPMGGRGRSRPFAPKGGPRKYHSARPGSENWRSTTTAVQSEVALEDQEISTRIVAVGLARRTPEAHRPVAPRAPRRRPSRPRTGGTSKRVLVASFTTRAASARRRFGFRECGRL